MWWPGFVLAAFLVATFGTMTFFRAYWQDDVQIVDWGRVIAQPESDWGVTWNVRDNRPVFLISHIGILLQYRFASLFGDSVGARLSGTVGGIFAFIVILRLFRRLGWSRNAVWLLGLVFLLDPFFCTSFRCGRADSFRAVAFMLLAVLLYARGRNQLHFAFLAGASAALALVIWPSAVLLAPLVFACAYGRAGQGATFRSMLRPAISFAVAAAVALALLLATHPRVRESAADLVELTQSVTMTEGAAPGNWLSAILEAVQAYRKHVLVLLLSFVSVAYLLSRRYFLLPLAFLSAFTVVAVISPYGNRILYLLPIHVLCIGTTLHVLKSNRAKRVLTGLLFFLVLWNSAFSTLLRPLEAVRMSETWAPELLDEPFAAAVGPGPHRVFGPWEVYFPGLRLGWHSFCDMRQGTLEEAIPRIDFDFAFVEGDDPETLRTFLQNGYREMPGWHPPAYAGKTFLLLKRG